MDMTTMLYVSVEHGLHKNVEYFVDWGGNLLKTNPNPELFVSMAKAYEYLAETNLYCDTVKLGLATYPSEQRLQELIKTCLQ
jgi:hypothetical protein